MFSRRVTIQLAIVAIVLVVGIALGAFLERDHKLGKKLERLGRPAIYGAPEIGLEVIPQGIQGELSLFILAGQSNIAGRGPVPEPLPTPHPRIFLFGNDYQWRPAVEPIDAPDDQVDLVSLDPDAGYSPGLAFAASLLEHRPEMVIGLIPCARGGSSIELWRPAYSDRTLYGSCLKRARAASTMGRVEGLLFFQGEADAMAPDLYTESALYPNAWGERFVEMVRRWRADLEQENLPVIFAQNGSHTEPEIFVNWAIVQAQQSLVRLPHSAMITTEDLPLADAVHFSPRAYRLLGERFAAAYLDVVEGR